MYCPKIIFVVVIKKKWRFYLQLLPFPVFEQDFKSKRTFPEEEKRCAIYLSYATLVTYVPVLGAEKFQFPCRIIFDKFLAED